MRHILYDIDNNTDNEHEEAHKDDEEVEDNKDNEIKMIIRINLKLIKDKDNKG